MDAPEKPKKERANKARTMTLNDDELRNLLRTVLQENEAHRLATQGMTDKDHINDHQWLSEQKEFWSNMSKLVEDTRNDLFKGGAKFLAILLLLAVVYGVGQAWSKLAGP